MSVHLARMLGRPENEITEFVQQMEDKFCYPSHDVRLHDEVSGATKYKTASLGLDPQDTTAQELYYSLQVRFAADAQLIDKALGIGPDTSFEERLIKAVDLASHVMGSPEVWALKSTVAKNVLLAQPPKKLMKQLHYRSLDSMLKHENVGKLFILSQRFESKSWQNLLAKATSHLSSSDYVLSPINFVHIKDTDCQHVSEPPLMNISDRLTGSLGIWPVENTANLPVVSLILALLQGAENLGIEVKPNSLAGVHPALHWWTGVEHLISTHSDVPVSFNIYDVAHNHFKSHSHENGVRRRGAQALWSELSSRYQNMSEEIEDVAQAEFSKLMPAQLASQLQEA